MEISSLWGALFETREMFSCILQARTVGLSLFLFFSAAAGKMRRDSRGVQCSMTNTFCSVEDFVVRDNVMLGTICK